MIEQKTLKIKTTKEFNKNLKRIKTQGKDLAKLKTVIDTLVSYKELDTKYRNHKLKDNKYFKNCYECHIQPDWILVYQYINENLIFLLVNTEIHSELF